MVGMEPAVEALIAKQAITEVVYRYCRGVDRFDRELVRDCYWPEATDEHGSFTGTRDEYLTWLFERMLPRFTWSQHFVGNVLIDQLDLVAGRAKCETYGQSRHHRPSEVPEHNLISGFRYVDDFERRAGEWRIARRICPVEWVRVDDASMFFEAAPTHRRGTRDRHDPVYWRHDEFHPWPGAVRA
jgi:hypothetical protein